MRAFLLLVRWMRRQNPGLEYAAIKEEGAKTGMKHLHVVMLNWRFIPQEEIQCEWLRLTGSWNAQIKRITDTKGAALYVSKYVSKAVPFSRKSITYSAGFPKLPPLGALRYLGPAERPSSGRVTNRAAFVDSNLGCGCHGHEVPIPLWLMLRTGTFIRGAPP